MNVPKPDWASSMLESDRFAFNIGVSTAPSKMRLTLVHVRREVQVSLDVAGAGTDADLDASKAALCEQMAHRLIEARHTEHGIGHFARLLRCEYANRLIQVISSYGRCLFYSKKNDQVAYLTYDHRVYLHDEGSGQKIEVRAGCPWPGFSHNGTIRDLVEQLRNYVMRAQRLDPVYIGIDKLHGGGNVWGYAEDQIRLCRQAAAGLPVMGAESVERAA